MAVLDPEQTYTDGQLIYFKGETNATDVVQAFEYENLDLDPPLRGVVLANSNPWMGDCTAVYMKEERSYDRVNLNNLTIPSASNRDYSTYPKMWWSVAQSVVDPPLIPEANFSTHDYLYGVNAVSSDPYYGCRFGSVVRFGEWVGSNWAEQHNIDLIGIEGTASFIQAQSGSSYVNMDLRNSAQRNWKLKAVLHDTVRPSDGQIFRHMFWCFVDSNNVVKQSIKWMGGTFYDAPVNEEGEPMLEPDLPSLDITDTGMCKMYMFESSSEIASLLELSEFLWSDNFFDALVKTVDNPMDAIISFNGVAFADSVSVGTTRQVAVGNLFIPDCNARIVTKQYSRVDCGSISIPEFHGNYLDYEPFTEIRLFLPFIGFVSLSCADAVGKTLDIIYHCDIITGQCVAYVKDGTSGNVLYTYNGNCLQNLPMTGRNLPNMLTGILSASGIPTDMSKGLSVGNAISSGVQGVQGQYTRGGGITCVSGLLAPQRPYAVVTRRVPIVDANYHSITGQPYFKTATLSSVSGFTIVEQAQLKGITATQGELDEIDSLLKGGVIL